MRLFDENKCIHLLLILLFIIDICSALDSLNNISSSSSSSSLHASSINNSDNRLELIIKNYRINKNSIIKTHDSRSLGAKYLNETELSSNEECLFWCWNTSNCNLAVFEEKTRGSCYLFNCGTLQDFKCRFASHAFYTSSILQIDNKNSSLSLNEWKSQTSQENDLVGLKDKQSSIASHLEIKPDTTAASITKVSKCRHYQFECRNNSECIAIYNVCDGIAQCSDGSDESVELECHKSRFNNFNLDKDGQHASSSSSSSSSSSDMDSSNINRNLSTAKFAQNRAEIPLANYNDVIPSFVDSNNNLKSVPYLNNLNYNYPKSANDKHPPFSDNFSKNGHVQNEYKDYNNNLWANNWNQYSSSMAALPEKQIALSSISTTDENQFFNQQLLQQQQQQQQLKNAKELNYWPSFKYQQNYVPSHLTSSSNGNNEVSSYLLANSLSMMNDVGSQGKIDYSQIQQQKPLANVGQQFSQSYGLQKEQQPLTMLSNDKKKLAILTNGNMKMNSSIINDYQMINDNANLMDKTISDNDSKQKATIQLNHNNNNIKDNINGDESSSLTNAKGTKYSNMLLNEKMSIKNPSSPSNSLVAISYMHDHSVTQQQNGRETNSAVIALTLGLFITTILIVIVACRMKSFKKRLARRGRSLAHDADYLINAMYL